MVPKWPRSHRGQAGAWPCQAIGMATTTRAAHAKRRGSLCLDLRRPIDASNGSANRFGVVGGEEEPIGLVTRMPWPTPSIPGQADQATGTIGRTRFPCHDQCIALPVRCKTRRVSFIRPPNPQRQSGRRKTDRQPKDPKQPEQVRVDERTEPARSRGVVPKRSGANKRARTPPGVKHRCDR